MEFDFLKTFQPLRPDFKIVYVKVGCIFAVLILFEILALWISFHFEIGMYVFRQKLLSETDPST